MKKQYFSGNSYKTDSSENRGDLSDGSRGQGSYLLLVLSKLYSAPENWQHGGSMIGTNGRNHQMI